MRVILPIACILSVMIGSGLVLVFANPSRAEPDPIGRWLMSEPLTLWDIGLIRMEEKARTAAERVGKDVTKRGSAGVGYNWDNNEIDINVYMMGFNGDVTHESCNKIRRDFIRLLIGISIKSEEKRVAAWLPLQISSWFSHFGFKDPGRDKKLGEKMARTIFVNMNLWGEDSDISCRARIITSDAPSKPY